MDLKELLKSIYPDLQDYKEVLEKLIASELKPIEYKSTSGGFGTYPQRDPKKHMLRLRMTGGRLTKDGLKFIVDTCKKYNVPRLKLTTCQSIQLHDLAAENLYPIMEAAWNAGFITRGGGGNNPRNVMATPLSGVLKDELFDVLPYAEATAAYLLGFVGKRKFPRKLKVCFENSKENTTHSTFRDLGFVVNDDGTFSVYAAGGLGNNPKMGVCVEEKADPKYTLCYIKAMVEVFLENGDYENRARSRTRYLQEDMGVDGFKKAFKEKLDEAMSLGLPVIEPSDTSIEKSGNGTIDASISNRVTEQKQDSLYAVSYNPIGGFISPDTLEKLADVIADIPYSEIRVCPDGSLYVINCTADEAKKVCEVTSDNADTMFEKSVSCVGNSTCGIGISDSQALLKSCIDAVRKESFADGVLPRINISGCPSSCAAHQTAPLAFRGGVKRVDGVVKPAFTMFEGGCEKRGNEVIADSDKVILGENVPLFLVELGKKIAEDNSVYSEWIKTNHDVFDAIADKYILK